MDLREAAETVQVAGRQYEAILTIARAIEQAEVWSANIREIEQRLAARRQEEVDLAAMEKRVGALKHEIETLEQRRDRIRAAIRDAAGEQGLKGITPA